MRSERWLGWIAGFKLVKATFLLATSIAAIGLLDPARAAAMSHWATVVAADHHYRALDMLVGRLATIDAHTIRVLGLGSCLYALLFYVEGCGLFLRRRWAEYMTIVSTGALIPFEVFELQRHVTPPKLAILAANVCILAYLTQHVSTIAAGGTDVTG